MPLQTRVTPFGELVAESWRGQFMGNRGCLHDAQGRIGRARWRHRCWVCCLTEFRGRHRPVMPPPGYRTRYTALFFWDEACALAAGHRPCGECRHRDHQRYKAAWLAAGQQGQRASEIDRVLHAARIDRTRSQRRVPVSWRSLPDGAMVVSSDSPDQACLVWKGTLFAWSPGGYLPCHPDRPEQVSLLTPEPTVAAIAAGYRPIVGPFRG